MRRIISAIAALTLILCAIFSMASCQKKDSVDLSSAKSIADLEGLNISAQGGTFHEEARAQIKNVKGSVYPDFDALLAALKSGAIDGYVAEEPTAIQVTLTDSTLGYIHLVNNSTGFTATDADVAIAIGCKKGSELIGKINPVLATITAAQREALMDEIIKVNNGESVATFSVSNQAPETTNGTLKVAMECAYAPYNWTQTTDANGAVKISGGANDVYANGYDVQIAKYVANALGMELEVYAQEWDSLIAGIQAGTYDCIVAGMSPTEERKEKIDFSDIYYSSNLVVIYKKK